ncbi:pyrroloquinoline-quinone synthase [Tistlia consotensis]|uniref:Pyrroloquinoline-quinone synthase n=1 Tax=Tistlia consotensis USBA 355 TaxID=560819 RepID=A0A1Y6CNN0_9PROT|nr:pyrroloquinoline-quinone synthase PqqC [Tistlia consotensis]SMF80319.1 pyrroloquinoline-quinone synthase [Tistlia consotensis USBA 355]SNR62505.1 pyrroloquinoline-quinone synthase [Tistlia consotensis]
MSANPEPRDPAGETLLSAAELEARLQQIGRERYHSLHPFHKLLHGGRLNRGQVQAWVLNRFYYQSRIPIKDATLLSRCEDLELRREWRKRIEEHDGWPAGAGRERNEGGIERWLVLAEAVGLPRDYVVSTEGLLPATRFAVDAYVHFVREKSLLEAVASSLTELFAPKIHEERIAGLLQHYPFANERTIAYFKRRLKEAPEDVKFGLAYVIREARTRAQQEQVLAAVRFKTDVLWAQLDALHHAYVEPGHVPPGAFVPEGPQEWQASA